MYAQCWRESLMSLDLSFPVNFCVSAESQGAGGAECCPPQCVTSVTTLLGAVGCHPCSEMDFKHRVKVRKLRDTLLLLARALVFPRLRLLQGLDPLRNQNHSFCVSKLTTP